MGALRAFKAASNVPWLITQESLQLILEIAAREQPELEAVEAQLGRKLDNSHMVTIRDGVAMIPVEGPIVRYADLFTQISGATSIETLALDLRTALDDPSCRAILLNIDSPGGEVSGTNEFANMVHAARGIKPVVAYVGDLGASAAYWIASAASEVVVDATARVGSIGVVAAVPDPAKMSAKHLTFVSSQSPNKRPDPTTERGRSQLQGQIDALADVFVDTVARNRGVPRERVLADFGQGGLFVGVGAVKAGLADRVGSLESVLAELADPDSPCYAAPAAADLPATLPPQSAPAFGADAHTMPEEPAEKEQTMSAPVQLTEEHAAQLAELQTKFAAMEAERDAAKTEAAAMRQANEATLAEAKGANERIERMEAEARIRRFTEMAAGWVGETAAQVAVLAQLAASAGEGSAVFADHVRTQRAAAEQVRKGALFAEKGAAGTLRAGSPTERAHQAITARAKADGVTYEVAMSRVFAEDPSLYDAHAIVSEVHHAKARASEER